MTELPGFAPAAGDAVAFFGTASGLTAALGFDEEDGDAGVTGEAGVSSVAVSAASPLAKR